MYFNNSDMYSVIHSGEVKSAKAILAIEDILGTVFIVFFFF